MDINKIIMESTQAMMETAETTKEQKKIADSQVSVKPSAGDSKIPKGVTSVARKGMMTENEEVEEVSPLARAIPAAIATGLGAVILRNKLASIERN